ncbi:proton-conducting transporter membrane subunit [Aquabacter sp. CN5-332]|uniref:complex I subunit 5 family protein n=1 Tax=Aquabacter sp. CN5-332 TaxID=3156608 RepID=UPI0032B3446A
MSGFLLVLAIMLPPAWVALMLVAGGRASEHLAHLFVPFGLAISLVIAALVADGGPIIYFLGGWRPPLGVGLRADGLSAAMLVMTAVVMAATAVFAAPAFRTPEGQSEARAPFAFWVLLIALWGALNLVFLAQDLFTLFVALELLTFGAVPLVCLDGSAATLRAALRYLLFALVGSAFYLLGAALLYGAHGTLDILLLAERARAGTGAGITLFAICLMVAGMLAKAALFPFHLWLPPAHAGAPPAASVVLSALVIKAPIFLAMRLWYDIAPVPEAGATLLALLGAGAILFCGTLAFQQERLKLLVAYSTASQIGYLFLMFPLTGAEPFASIAWTGGVLHLVSHAFSKAAMFMAAGLIAEAMGHDRISGLSGVGRLLPMSVFAFGLGGLSLMGLPPSGGFTAKVMLLSAAVAQSAWWIAVVILLGGLLAGGYVLRLVLAAIAPGPMPVPVKAISRRRELIALALALCAIALGFVPLQPSSLLAIGRPGSWEAMP